MSGTSILPRPTGPFAVGTATATLVDEGRPEPLTGIPGDRRRLVVRTFFPAAPVPDASAPYLPARAAIAGWLAANPWPDGEAAILLDRYGPLAIPAAEHAPALAGPPRPLVILSPGGYQSQHHYGALALELASHGLLVAAVSHPHGGLDWFPGLGLLGRHPAWVVPPAADAATRQSIVEAMTAVLAADLRFVIDNADALPGLAGTVDATRIALLGHSRGGRAVARAAAEDARVRTAVILDNPPPDRLLSFEGALLLVRVAGYDADTHWRSPGAPPRWTPEKVDAARRLVCGLPGPAYDVAVSGLGHMSVSDRPFVEPERFPTPRGAANGFAVVAAVVRSFLARHLAVGAGTSLPDIPGVTILANRR